MMQGQGRSNGSAAISEAKTLVLDFHRELEQCSKNDIPKILSHYTTNESYLFRSVYPFRELVGTTTVSNRFWTPLKTSFTNLQRRPDIFIGGFNSIHESNENENDSNTTTTTTKEEEGVWVLSMGHFMGLFDQDWLGIRRTRQMATIRYAEFSHVKVVNQQPKIAQTGLFLDIVGLMQSVGMNPLPPSTGAHFCYPGPKTHDGLLYENAPPEEGIQTQALVDKMVDDLSSINQAYTCDPELLQRTWHDDMIWYGPAGIGATYTIPRYQEQHQLPFRARLKDKVFHGHQVRVAEGNYAAFFGWPMNLTNTPMGGFLGLPGGSCAECPMQVVDVYRREGEKLSENWVLLDMLWYLKHQGVDILERTTGILNPRSLLQFTPPAVVASASVAESPSLSEGSDGYVHVSPQVEAIDYRKVTHAATVDMSDVLEESSTRQKGMPMPGFDDGFLDIVDYILKITFWIWHEKKVELCRDYYSEDCPMHTMAGDLHGVETVVKGTYSTLEAFPDRTLDGENVVWSKEPPSDKYGSNPVVYYSSHLITSRMTNKGESEWGPATNVLARIRTVADCVCTENRIVEEWLMRDNYHLVTTLGFDAHKIAEQQAKKDIENGRNLLELLEPERKRVYANALPSSCGVENNKDLAKLKTISATTVPDVEARAFAEALFGTLWQEQAWEKVPSFYDYRAAAHLTAGREVWGTVEMKEFLQKFQTGLSNIAVSIDHVACIPYLGEDSFDVAIRWSLAAEHTGDSEVLGKASETPIYILASTHLRIIRNRIREEWTVFDELVLLRQIATQKLISGQ